MKTALQIVPVEELVIKIGVVQVLRQLGSTTMSHPKPRGLARSQSLLVGVGVGDCRSLLSDR